jgi:glucose-6-phosphate 1-dehydrogenase
MHQSTVGPTTVVIIGITGDLSRRYLLPALEEIAAAGHLPQQFRIVGTTRQHVTKSSFASSLAPSLPFVTKKLEILQLDPTVEQDYKTLETYLEKTEKTVRDEAQRIFYVSVPPQIAWPVVELLGESGLSRHSRTKLLLEKPFGTDLETATQLIQHVDRYFEPQAVYRIDHYLAKEMAQNLLVFRRANPLFTHTWNKDFIERVDITISESIDIEGRALFYEQTGALRDVMQSHGLQLAALTLMNPSFDSLQDVPRQRLDALRHIMVADAPTEHAVIRAQYEGYREEVANPRSSVETYVRIRLASDDERWEGVPIVITTGKAMPAKETAIRITYKSTPDTEPNQLTLRFQPNAGIELELWSKAPGYVHKLEKQKLRFNYTDVHPKLPGAYEKVLLDAILSDHALFTSSEEVVESWRILDPIQRAWSLSDDDLVRYEKFTDPNIGFSKKE